MIAFLNRQLNERGGLSSTVLPPTSSKYGLPPSSTYGKPPAPLASATLSNSNFKPTFTSLDQLNSNSANLTSSNNPQALPAGNVSARANSFERSPTYRGMAIGGITSALNMNTPSSTVSSMTNSMMGSQSINLAPVAKNMPPSTKAAENTGKAFNYSMPAR